MSTRKTHGNVVDLLGDLIDVPCKLLGHVQEGNHDINGKRQTRNREIRSSRYQEQAACCSTENVKNIADIPDDGTEHVRIGMCTEAVLEQFVIDAGLTKNSAAKYVSYLNNACRDLNTIHNHMDLIANILDADTQAIYAEEIRTAIINAQKDPSCTIKAKDLREKNHHRFRFLNLRLFS